MQICKPTRKGQKRKLELLCSELQTGILAAFIPQDMSARAFNMHSKELTSCTDQVTYKA